jgi:uncharacterized protein
LYFSHIFVYKNKKMVGRKEQLYTMEELLGLQKSYFVAVTGRRRVGKTYLIDEVYKNNICFRVTGILDGSQDAQIVNFVQQLAEYSNIPIVTLPQNWQQVFFLLKKYLETLPKNKKQVIFIDELPWMATVRSGFIQLLAHLWNDYLSKQKHFILAICGSATSWISKKIISDTGGFHNRITHHIQLPPFTLAETKLFLLSKKIKLVDDEIAALYMALGGIPYYLELIRKGESAAEAIDRLCFAEGGLLKTEYRHLYKALFNESAHHEAMVKALAKSRYGLDRIELSEKSKVSTGGPFTRTIEDLVLSGFVVEQHPFGKIKQGTVYRLTDEFSVFYHRFIATHTKAVAGIWQEIAKTQPYKIWLGYAFEALCMRHLPQVKRAMGIANVYTEVSSFYKKADRENEGIQIDLVLDRVDKSINLCECKYYSQPFEITKQYAKTLDNRKQIFKENTATKKNVFNTLITNQAVIKNDYYFNTIDKLVLLEDLFV